MQDTNIILRIAPPLTNDHKNIGLIPQREETVVVSFSTKMNSGSSYFSCNRD